jgi:hypothetical protein
MFFLAPTLALTIVSVDIEIQQVVPDTTIAVVSIDNVAQLMKNLKQSGVCDSVCEFTTTLSDEFGFSSCFSDNAQCDEMFQTLGIDKENWSPPSGHAGFAMYPVVDYEVGTVGIGVFGMIELNDEMYENLFSEKFELLMTDSDVEFETVNLAGRDVWMFQVGGSEVMDLADAMPLPQLNIDPTAFDQAYVVYSDGYLLFGTEPDAVATALSAIDGDFEKDTLASNADYESLVDRCENNGDVFAGVLLTNLSDTIVQMDSSAMALMILPSIKTIFGDIDGVAESVNFSPSSDVLIEGTYTALMNDGRSGLVSLIGDNTSPVPIPAFVAENVIAYTQGQIDLQKFAPLVKEAILSNPMLGMQMGQQMEQMEAGFNFFLSPLGSTFHSFSTGQLPLDEYGIGYMIAVECKDEKAFSDGLALTMPMAGAKSSDFLGNQMYTIDMGMLVPLPMPFPIELSISVGGGYALFGSPNTVENALRIIANPSSTSVKRTTNAATSLLSHTDVSAWGYGDMKKSIEIQAAVSASMSENMLEEMEAFDPIMAAEMREEFEASNEMQAMILDFIASMLGPMSWTMGVDDTGVTAHVVMLKPVAE